VPPDLDLLRAAFVAGHYLWTAHASDRAAQRAIFSSEVEEVVVSGEVIEDYPEDKYGPSCLLLGRTASGRVLHVQVSYPPPIKIITVYEPRPDEWEDDFRVRKSYE